MNTPCASRYNAGARAYMPRSSPHSYQSPRVLRASSPALRSGTAAVSAITSDVAADAKAVADQARDDKLKKKIAELIAAKQRVTNTANELLAATNAQTDSPSDANTAAVSAATVAHDAAVAAWSALVKATRDSAAVTRAKIAAAARAKFGGDKKGKFELGWSQWTIVVTVLALALAQIIRMFMKLSKKSALPA